MTSPFSRNLKLTAALAATLVATGCTRQGDVDASGGVVAVRSACPDAAIPAMTGDITLFNPADSRDLAALDVTAAITNLRSSCSDADGKLYSEASFDVVARRSFADGAREVVLPYFATVVRGGDAVISKRVGEVRLNFAPGEYRAVASAKAGAFIDRGAATLPEDIEKRITRRREAGDADAALDPFADPDVRDAVKRTTFELLVGFNLTQDQLRYNATR